MNHKKYTSQIYDIYVINYGYMYSMYSLKSTDLDREREGEETKE